MKFSLPSGTIYMQANDIVCPHCKKVNRPSKSDKIIICVRCGNEIKVAR